MLGRAVCFLGEFQSGEELYDTLTDQIGLTDDEIREIGFKSLAPFFNRDYYAQTIAEYLIDEGTDKTHSGNYHFSFAEVNERFGTSLPGDKERLDNEIARTLEGYDFDKDALREKLYQRASLGYLQIGDEAYVEHKLKNTLEQHDTLDSFDSELTNKTVKLIKLAENGSVSIILINDQEIRKEQTDHANSNPSDAT